MKADELDTQEREPIAQAAKGKGFFALDVDQFFRIQSEGLGIEEAATYLALMKSTDQTNTISRGGVHSIMEYTGLTRSEAKRAIEHLARVGVVEKLDVERTRAKTLPRFKLPIHEARKPLASFEAAVVAKIEAGEQPTAKGDINAAQRAGQKGWLEKLSTGWATVPPSQRIAYIPNIFVHMDGQTSPLGRLVQVGELGPVMLAAELYHKQDLMNERGVPTSAIRAYYRPAGSITAGNSPSGYRLHYLQPGRPYTDKREQKSFDRAYEPQMFRHDKEAFWTDLRALDSAHVVEWAIYSANGKPKGEYDFNRPQRMLGVLRNGKQVQNTPEAAVAFVAYHLWLEQQRIAQDFEFPELDQAISYWREQSPIIAVENAHVAHVEGVGILRMVYRADTENTAQWFRYLHRERREALFFLENVRKTAFPETLAIQWDSLPQGKAGAAISK